MVLLNRTYDKLTNYLLQQMMIMMIITEMVDATTYYNECLIYYSTHARQLARSNHQQYNQGSKYITQNPYHRYHD